MGAARGSSDAFLGQAERRGVSPTNTTAQAKPRQSVREREPSSEVSEQMGTDLTQAPGAGFTRVGFFGRSRKRPQK